jgi:anaerobic ribonucleoside-triphosphate reductase
MPGRAPQRVFFKHDPMNLIKEIDFPEDKVKASIEVVAVSKAYGKQVLATSRSNEKRINEIESEIADWRNSAERGTERAVNYAELRIKSLQEELEKELKNL